MIDAFHADLRDYACVKIGVIAVGTFASKDAQLQYLHSLQQRRRQVISDQHYSGRGVFSTKHKGGADVKRVLQLKFCAMSLEEAAAQLRSGEGLKPKKPWENFQAHRTVFGIIGFCDGQRNSNVITAFEKWNSAVERLFPNTTVTQFHILNPSSEQEDDRRIRNSNSIHVFPYRASEKTRAAFTDRIVLRLAVNFKQTFDNWLRAAESGETAILQKQGILDLQSDIETPVASGNSGLGLGNSGAGIGSGSGQSTGPATPASGNSASGPQFNNARWRGRLSKWKGDYCLLAGLVGDAETNYSKARDVCGSQRDSFWQAGAYLGLAAAAATHIELGSTGSSSESTGAPTSFGQSAIKRQGPVPYQPPAESVGPSASGVTGTGHSVAECRARMLSNTELSLQHFQKESGIVDTQEFVATTMFILAAHHLEEYQHLSKPFGPFEGFGQQLWQRPAFTASGREENAASESTLPEAQLTAALAHRRICLRYVSQGWACLNAENVGTSVLGVGDGPGDVLRPSAVYHSSDHGRSPRPKRASSGAGSLTASAANAAAMRFHSGSPRTQLDGQSPMLPFLDAGQLRRQQQQPGSRVEEGGRGQAEVQLKIAVTLRAAQICNGAAARRKFAYFVALLARLLYSVEWDDFALNVQVLLQKLLTTGVWGAGRTASLPSQSKPSGTVANQAPQAAIAHSLAGFPKLRWDSMALVVFLSQGSRDAITTAKHAVEALSLFHSERIQDDTDFQNQATMARILQSYLALHFPRYLPTDGDILESATSALPRGNDDQVASTAVDSGSPNAPVLPLVVMMRSLDQSSGRRMVQLSTEAAREGFAAFEKAAAGTEKRAYGGTFHNPFAERQSGRRRPKERKKWIVGEPVLVEVVIQNPLAIAVFVPQLTLYTRFGPGSAAVQTVPVSALLHARYATAVRVHVLPTKAGLLEFTHAIVQVFGMVCRFPLHPLPAGGLQPSGDATGIRSADQTSVALPLGAVMGSSGSGHIPLIDVYPSQPQIHMTLQNRSGRALEGSAAFIRGEQQKTCLELHNVGTVPITAFSITVEVEVYHTAVGKGSGYCTTHSFPVMLWNRGHLQVLTPTISDQGDDKRNPSLATLCEFHFGDHLCPSNTLDGDRFGVSAETVGGSSVNEDEGILFDSNMSFCINVTFFGSPRFRNIEFHVKYGNVDLREEAGPRRGSLSDDPLSGGEHSKGHHIFCDEILKLRYIVHDPLVINSVRIVPACKAGTLAVEAMGDNFATDAQIHATSEAWFLAVCDIENTSEHHDFTFSLAYENHCDESRNNDDPLHCSSGSRCQLIKARSKLLCTMSFPRRSICRIASASETEQFLENELRSRLCLKWVLQQTRTGHTQLSDTTIITGVLHTLLAPVVPIAVLTPVESETHRPTTNTALCGDAGRAIGAEMPHLLHSTKSLPSAVSKSAETARVKCFDMSLLKLSVRLRQRALHPSLMWGTERVAAVAAVLDVCVFQRDSFREVNKCMETNVALAGPSKFQFLLNSENFVSSEATDTRDTIGPELFTAEVPLLFLQPGHYCIATRCSMRYSPTEVSCYDMTEVVVI
eukprot:INCI4993.10.p1 GENE.INCI4993.10~~INCI4993.10.p1  ORF type:complete len:1559 (+),score=254.90 INCI4993.10:230-4906(+)